MDWRRMVGAAVIGLALIAAGCVQSDPGSEAADTTPTFEAADHTERSERTIATVTTIEGELSWDDLDVVVDGKTHTFGEFVDVADRRYAVDGRSDAHEPVEMNDVIRIPAGGDVTVEFVHAADGAVLWSYQATVPDNAAPEAPMNMEPANDAEGVSQTPTFRWTRVVDASGVQYEIEVSLDQTFSTPALDRTADGLAEPQYTIPSGEDLEGGQTHYWHVRAVDGQGNTGPWSATWSFNTAGGGSLDQV